MPNTFLQLRLRPLWWSVGAALVALVIYGSLATGGPVTTITVWDKLQHLVAYGVLGVYFCGLVTPRTYRWVFGLLLLLSLVLEYLQRQGGVRHFDWLDMVFNGAGLLLGVLLARAGLRHWSRVVERVLA